MHDYQNISNSELEKYIDEWIKSERDRKILKRRLIDHIKYEPLAEEFELSDRHVKTIVYKAESALFKHIQEDVKNREWAEKVCLSGITYVIFCNNQ